MFFYTSPILGWKYIRFVQYKAYFEEAEYLKNLTIGLATLLFIFLCLINNIWLRRLTRPAKEIVTGMNEVGKSNFDIFLNVKSKDEFGIIAKGFNSMVAKIRELFEKAILEEEKSKEAELAALQYQINPHFLQNTIYAIRLTAIFKGEKEISDMLSILGNFLQNTLKNVNKLITLQEEFENMKSYISLYQIRFSNNIFSEFEVEQGLDNCKLYGMLIQPVIENAIMHGLSEKLNTGEAAKIHVRAAQENENLIIAVRDNGIGMTEKQCQDVMSGKYAQQGHGHIGLYNIHKRINYLYGDNYGINILTEKDKFTEIKITLPIIMSHENDNKKEVKNKKLQEDKKNQEMSINFI